MLVSLSASYLQIRFDKVAEQKEIRLLRDRRCDLPGYSAKCDTFTVMKSTSEKMLDFQVCHSKIAGNLERMELEWLKVVLQRLNNNMINVKDLTTDSHKQIRAYLRKERPEIEHQFDVWYVGKNIKKKNR